MKHLSLSLSFTFVLAPLLIASASQAAVYGTDDRRESAADPQMSDLARATAIMVSPSFVTTDAQGLVNVAFPSLSDPDGDVNVCTDERFAKQPADPIACTGFLIAPDLLITAGHCTVNSGKADNQMTPFCENFEWLFDYETKSDGSVQTTGIDPARLVRCKNVISARFMVDYDKTTDRYTYQEDYALIQLERPMTDRAPLTLAPAIKDQSSLAMIGYPSGLPAKTTKLGRVLDNTDVNFFRANLSAFGGDSGAPVFDVNNQVVGLLVRSFPDPDYFTVPVFAGSADTCNRVNVCDFNGKNCKDDDKNVHTGGSEIQRIAPLVDLLKQR